MNSIQIAQLRETRDIQYLMAEILQYHSEGIRCP